MRKQLNIKIYENDVHQYRDFTDGNVTGVWSLVISAERW